MLLKLKTWLRNKLFANEELEYQAKKMALSAMQNNASIVALAREQLKGFNPRLISLDKVRNRAVLTLYDGLDEAETEALIKDIHSLYANEALKVLIDYITRNQILYGQMEAENDLQLNFSRGTVNGLILLQAKIEEVEGVYKKLYQTKADPFDKFNVL